MRRVALAAAVALSSASAGCGGGMYSSGSRQGGTISGAVVKGPVAGATVAAFAVAANGGRGVQVGSATTDAAGHFTMAIGDHAGPLVLQASGGTYADEATGTTMTMASGDVMKAAIPAVGAGATMQGVQVTPLTSMAQARAQAMAGGMTAANVSAANAAVGDYFQAGDILSTMPMDPTVAASGASATPDARNYGMAIAAICELAQTVGMTASSGMVTALTEDASDGVMDGMMGATPISMTGMGGGMMGGGTMMPAKAGTSGLGAAMAAYVGTAMNRSGVTAAQMQPLVDRLDASNGTLR